MKVVVCVDLPEYLGVKGMDQVVKFRLAWKLEGLLKLSGFNVFQVGKSEDLVAGRPYAKIQFSVGFLQSRILMDLSDLSILQQVLRQMSSFL